MEDLDSFKEPDPFAKEFLSQIGTITKSSFLHYCSIIGFEDDELAPMYLANELCEDVDIFAKAQKDFKANLSLEKLPFFGLDVSQNTEHEIGWNMNNRKLTEMEYALSIVYSAGFLKKYMDQPKLKEIDVLARISGLENLFKFVDDNISIRRRHRESIINKIPFCVLQFHTNLSNHREFPTEFRNIYQMYARENILQRRLNSFNSLPFNFHSDIDFSPN